ncbi:MAG: M20/M25/M40 family metallo-hydrolase [Phycisphaerae bacterium]|jgi:hypothetical protein
MKKTRFALPSSIIRVAGRAMVVFALAASWSAAVASGGDAAADEAANRPRNSFGWTAVVDGKPAAAPEMPMGDEVVVHSILDEGKNRNRVMDHLTHLCKAIGPRLTASTAVEQANLWCKEQYERWGLTDARIEKYGEAAVRFDRGPSSAKIVLRRERRKEGEAVETSYDTLRDCQFTTLSWSSGTQGSLRAPVVREPISDEQYAAVKDRLKGAWILVAAPSPVGQRGIRSMMGARFDALRDARRKVKEGASVESLSLVERLAQSGAAGYISTSRDERVWTGAVPGWRELDLATVPPEPLVQIRLSDYDFLNSRLADGEPVEFEADLKHTLQQGPIPLYNTIAEIRGSELPDEVVIVSAHLDSWNGPGSEGTTDNGTGSAVTLEAARILAAVGAKPRRTIRFINWTGEEQGLLGSKGYADANKDLLPKVSAVFVDDGGTNYQGGAPCADVMAEYLAAATAPTNYQFFSATDGKWLNVSIRKNGARNPRGGGSDHATFNAVGVPGFFWDEVGRADYGYGWHTQHDHLDLAIPEYLVQSSTNTAIAAYRLACAPNLLPRELPGAAEATEGERPRPRRDRRAN